MSESGGLLWVKILGLVLAGAAFVVWQWLDLRKAAAASKKKRDEPHEGSKH